MRAFLVALVGLVVAMSGAWAGECRSHTLAFTAPDGRFFKAAETSITDVAGKRGGHRIIFRGLLDSKPHILDIQGFPGANHIVTSYAGRVPKKSPYLPNWGQSPQWLGSSSLTIDDGPLKGLWQVEWQTACR